jgi:translocation and assembly module TamA
MILSCISTANVRACLTILLLTITTGIHAAQLSYEIDGVSDPLLANIESHIQAFSIGRQSDVTEQDFDGVLADVTRKTRAALRPYGYYNPDIVGSVTQKPNGDAVVRLIIAAGPPVLIDKVTVELLGPGADHAALKSWRDTWPLSSGATLNQIVWEERKQAVLGEAQQIGYLGATFSSHKLELDLTTNKANVILILDTGPRYHFGDIEYGEHVLKPGIVEYVPRFHTGDFYSRRLLNKFRVDLWKTGVFSEVVVEEIPRAELDPPVVDIKVQLETATRNTYQGSLGLGSDTGMRVQTQWSRNPMSSNGDRLDVGVGWQERDDEYSLRGNYRLPRRSREREYWTSALVVRHESIDVDIRQTSNDEFVRIASGTIDEQHLRLGRLKVRNQKSGEQQAFETLFVQVLNASDQLQPVVNTPELLALSLSPEFEKLRRGSDKTISFGVDYDLVAVTGQAWQTSGRRDRAWIFGSSKSLGSDRDFIQAYISTRRSYLKGERWRFLVRGELGYTKTNVERFALDLGSTPIDVSVSTLPNFYRFRAGGSNSVRGYGFEELSNNLLGSSNIVTASAEVEMKFLQNWSAAAFVDVGNAFNDWNEPKLKMGAGVGIRWYSIAGPIRVDLAQALDLIDKPWRIHFTIGTPLL